MAKVHKICSLHAGRKRTIGAKGTRFRRILEHTREQRQVDIYTQDNKGRWRMQPIIRVKVLHATKGWRDNWVRR